MSVKYEGQLLVAIDRNHMTTKYLLFYHVSLLKQKPDIVRGGFLYHFFEGIENVLHVFID